MKVLNRTHKSVDKNQVLLHIKRSTQTVGSEDSIFSYETEKLRRLYKMNLVFFTVHQTYLGLRNQGV